MFRAWKNGQIDLRLLPCPNHGNMTTRSRHGLFLELAVLEPKFQSTDKFTSRAFEVLYYASKPENTKQILRDKNLNNNVANMRSLISKLENVRKSENNAHT